MGLGNVVLGVLLMWLTVGQGPVMPSVGAVVFFFSSLPYLFSLLLSVGDGSMEGWMDGWMPGEFTSFSNSISVISRRWRMIIEGNGTPFTIKKIGARTRDRLISRQAETVQ